LEITKLEGKKKKKNNNKKKKKKNNFLKIKISFILFFVNQLNKYIIIIWKIYYKYIEVN